MPAPPEVMLVTRFDELSPPDAAAALLPCCASRRWASQVTTGRPYATLTALTSASAAVIPLLDWADIEEALAAHPRIGARAGSAAPPAALSEREAAWSAQEQQATATIGAGVADQLRDGNVAYEQRFGYVFLICATGKSAGQMLASLRERLGHDDAAEREVVRGQLREIVALRLARAFR